MTALAHLFDFPVVTQEKSNEWYTPRVYIEAAREVMGGIDLDPASCELANRTVKATRYYSKVENGLLQEWHGNVWLNPPFGLVTPGLRGSTKSIQVYFMHTLLDKYHSGEIEQAIALVFGTSFCMPWFEPFLAFPSCIVRHRIVFDKPDGSTDYFGYGNIFIYFGPHEQRFIDVFSQFGRIVKAVHSPRQAVVPLSLWEGREHASLSTQAPQEATQAYSTQALQPTHESTTSEEGSN